MINITDDPGAINKQSGHPAQSAYIEADAVQVTWYALVSNETAPGMATGLGWAALWCGRCPGLWAGRPYDPSKLYLGSGQKDPLFRESAVNARNAAAEIVTRFLQWAAEHPGQSLAGAKDDKYKALKQKLRYVSYRLTTSAAGMSRKQVADFCKEYGPADDDEPYCAEYLAKWSGVIDLDIDGITGWICGRPAAEQLARMLPRLGMAGLIAAQQSPSGCGLSLLVYVDRSAIKCRADFKRTYRAIYEDVARVCDALGCALPGVDEAYSGSKNLISGSGRYASPWPWYGRQGRWAVEDYRGAEGEGRARKLSERMQANIRINDGVIIRHKEDVARVRPWAPNSIPLPAKMTAPVDHDPGQHISGPWAPAQKRLAPVNAPTHEEILARRAEAKAAKQEAEAARRRLAEITAQGGGDLYKRREDAYLKAVVFGNGSNPGELQRIATAPDGQGDNTTHQALFKIGQAYKERGRPREIDEDLMALLIDAIKASGLITGPKGHDPAKWLQRSFERGWDSASYAILDDRPRDDGPRVIFRMDEPTAPATVAEIEAAIKADPAKFEGLRWDRDAAAIMQRMAAPATSLPGGVATPSDSAAQVRGNVDATPAGCNVLPSAAASREAAELIFEAIKDDVFLCGEDWFTREGPHFDGVIFERISSRGLKARILDIINRLDLRVDKGRDREGNAITVPYPQTLKVASDLELHLITLCKERGRSAKEMRFDCILCNGKANSEVYLTADGHAVTFDRGKGSARITDQLAGYVADAVQLATPPALKNQKGNGEGELLTWDDLPTSDPVRKMITYFAGDDDARRQRLLMQIGRIIARRPAFDASTSQGISIWYGPPGSGKTALTTIIEAVRGGRLASSRRAKETALDAQNRFGAAELYSSAVVYLDDITWRKANVSVLLNLTADEHEVERKNKDSVKVYGVPNALIIANNEPPLAGNVGGVRRRLLPFVFDKEADGAEIGRFVRMARDDEAFRAKLISTACAEYFRQLAEGYTQTADDAALDAQAEEMTPFDGMMRRFFEPSSRPRVTLSEYSLRKILATAEGRPLEPWEIKAARAAVRNIFGRDAVITDAQRHYSYKIQTNARFAELSYELAQRRQLDSTLRMIDLDAEMAGPAESAQAADGIKDALPGGVATPSDTPAQVQMEIITDDRPRDDGRRPAKQVHTPAPFAGSCTEYAAQWAAQFLAILAASSAEWRPLIRPTTTPRTFRAEITGLKGRMDSAALDMDTKAQLEGHILTGLQWAADEIKKEQEG